MNKIPQNDKKGPKINVEPCLGACFKFRLKGGALVGRKALNQRWGEGVSASTNCNFILAKSLIKRQKLHIIHLNVKSIFKCLSFVKTVVGFSYTIKIKLEENLTGIKYSLLFLLSRNHLNPCSENLEVHYDSLLKRVAINLFVDSTARDMHNILKVLENLSTAKKKLQ